MERFLIEIRQTRLYHVAINADSEEEAIALAEKRYNIENIDEPLDLFYSNYTICGPEEDEGEPMSAPPGSYKILEVPVTFDKDKNMIIDEKYQQIINNYRRK